MSIIIILKFMDHKITIISFVLESYLVLFPISENMLPVSITENDVNHRLVIYDLYYVEVLFIFLS